ncbi:MAG: hypothetical protein NVS3B1_06330 [Marmoricola sp.]
MATITDADSVKEWLDNPQLSLGNCDFETYDLKAQAVAFLLKEAGCASVSLAPGNGTQYNVVLTMLDEVGIKRLGGDLLVSLPNFGTCWVMQSTYGPFVPHYIAEKAKVGHSDATVLAALLTLIGSHLS